jgi:uncharacterized protein (TIRG00374 family)
VRVRDHVALTTVGAMLLYPRLKGAALAPWAVGIFLDVDHYLWFCAHERTLSLKKAVRFFNQAQPPQHAGTRALHHPLILPLLVALSVPWRGARLLLMGFVFHVGLDIYHQIRLIGARRKALRRDDFTCQQCGAQGADAIAHLWRQPLLLPSYRTQHFISLCGRCHEAAHSKGTTGEITRYPFLVMHRPLAQSEDARRNMRHSPVDTMEPSMASKSISTRRWLIRLYLRMAPALLVAMILAFSIVRLTKRTGLFATSRRQASGRQAIGSSLTSQESGATQQAIDPSAITARRGYTRHASGVYGRLAVGLLIALVLIVTFVRLIDLSSVAQRLERLNIPLALLCGLVFLGAFAVRALRWRGLLAPHQITARRAVAIYQVATFVNWLLPIRAGEITKCLLLRRLNAIPISASLPTVAMDKLMDLLPAIGLFAILPFLPLQLSRPLWILLLSVLIVQIAAGLFLALAVWRRQMALALLSSFTAHLPALVRRRVEPFTLRFVEALLGMMMRPRMLAIAMLYTLIAVGLDALFCLLAFQAVGASIAFPGALYGYTFYNMAYLLPSPPGQLGSNELVGLLVFSGLLHINRSAVAAMFLFSHPWTALLMASSGILCLSAMGLTLRSTLAMMKAPAERAEQRTVVVQTSESADEGMTGRR